MRIFAISLLAGCLVSCTSLNIIHDPQAGVITREEVQSFIKSVRCELKTFYTVNGQRATAYRERMNKYYDIVKQAARIGKTDVGKGQQLASEASLIRGEAVRHYPHFLLADDLFGGVFLNLKVADTLGVGVQDANIVTKHVFNPASSLSWGFQPTLNSQNTYEMNYGFIIDQHPGLVKVSAAPDDFECYKVAVPVQMLEEVASGKVPDQEDFHRIYVNGTTPLAAWLLSNSADLWSNFQPAATVYQQEQLIPVQMNYTFTVQFTAGIDVRYSLISGSLSPAQLGGAVSTVQTSQLQLYFNGVDAFLAAGAKTGTAVNIARTVQKKPDQGQVAVPDLNRYRNVFDLKSPLKLRLKELIEKDSTKSKEDKDLLSKKVEDETLTGKARAQLNDEQKEVWDKIKSFSQPAPRAREVPPAPSQGNGMFSRGYLLPTPNYLCPPNVNCNP